MNAGNTIYPHKYGKNRNSPFEADVVNALNVVPECATGQAGVKYFEFPLTDLVFAGGLKGSQGSPGAIGTSQTPTSKAVPRTNNYSLMMTHRGADDDGSFLHCVHDP